MNDILTLLPSKRPKNTPARLLTTKLSWCIGTIILDTLWSRSSNNSPAKVRSPRDWTVSVLPDALAVCLVPWQRFLGRERNTRASTLSSLPPSQGSASPLTTSINGTRLLWPGQRYTHQDPLQECHDLSQPLFKAPIPIRLSHDQQSHLVGNNWRQVSTWTIYCHAQHQDPTLSLQ